MILIRFLRYLDYGQLGNDDGRRDRLPSWVVIIFLSLGLTLALGLTIPLGLTT